jgi:hypothetical protein
VNNIELYIERLIMEGIPVARGDMHLLQASVVQELTRLIAGGGLGPRLSGGVALSALVSPVIRLNTGNGVTTFGQQIAGAVYDEVGK